MDNLEIGTQLQVVIPNGKTDVVNPYGVNSKNGKDIYYVLVSKDDEPDVDENGFTRANKRTFVIKGDEDFLRKHYPLGKVITGKRILVVEDNEAAFEGQQPKINPTTGEIQMHGGMPIYRHTFLVNEDSDKKDFFFPKDECSAGDILEGFISPIEVGRKIPIQA